jgi:hypothetical protein
VMYSNPDHLPSSQISYFHWSG